MYQLFYVSEKLPEPSVVAKDKTHKAEWGSRGYDANSLRTLRGWLGKMDAIDSSCWGSLTRANGT